MQDLNVKKAKFFLELKFYLQSLVFSLFIFALSYVYISWQSIPSALNKSVADTAAFLVGSSMIMSGMAYFFNFLDRKVIYRKYIGLMGFAFAMVHLMLSFSAFQNLLKVETWQNLTMWPMLAGLLALIIFTLMALVSNQLAIRFLGAKLWRGILRFGYVGIFFVLVHVFLLKSARWLTWLQGGMQGWPSLSLMVGVFAVLVILLRIALWLSLKRRRKNVR